MPRTFRVVCVFVAIFISIVPTFCQSESNPPNSQIGAGANETGVPNPNLLQSELSSALIPPCVLVGTTSGNFNALIYVDVTVPEPLGSPTYAAITWGSGTCTTATTCTIIFQNPPPGPAQVILSTTSTAPAIDPAWMDVSGSPLVIFSGDPAAGTYWFPSGGPNTFLYMIVQQVGQWFSDTDPTPKAGEYPTLQWQPGTVTIIYQ